MDLFDDFYDVDTADLEFGLDTLEALNSLEGFNNA